jgi:hypothetical protein
MTIPPTGIKAIVTKMSTLWELGRLEVVAAVNPSIPLNTRPARLRVGLEVVADGKPQPQVATHVRRKRKLII